MIYSMNSDFFKKIIKCDNNLTYDIENEMHDIIKMFNNAELMLNNTNKYIKEMNDIDLLRNDIFNSLKIDLKEFELYTSNNIIE
jgi:hypothetical protein